MKDYKYCINEKLAELPVAKYRATKEKIITGLKKTARTFNRYCNLLADDHADIPAQDLDMIASHLECTADELKNYKVNKSTIMYKIKRRSRKPV
ncbi:hypothetical protein [Aquimarina sp. AU58]|jgi:DNA-binding Xre family transcriptional regulator|uniref:hypothetical protein n=1 Tax=Aquimarina sp. AU58 TaxID=1874112 RepID=UPI000D6540B5|nr:hypothetical protein [Aquimarina sp. AU58]